MQNVDSIGEGGDPDLNTRRPAAKLASRHSCRHPSSLVVFLAKEKLTMGEARRRGSREVREKEAIRRNKAELVRDMDDMDERGRAFLQAGLKPFLDRMSPEQWSARRNNILRSLRDRPVGTELGKAAAIRVRDDEIGWYLFLCQQAIDDPMCTDVNQSQRALPFFAGIGSRWRHAHRVVGLDRKIDQLLTDYRQEPDGVIFELLVALAYAAAGWSVELLEEGSSKSPDMRVVRDNQEFYVECKRLARRTQYAENERNEFLRMWDRAKPLLMENRQWIWFKGVFHVDTPELSTDFLHDVWKASLPIGAGETLIHDSAQATIHARLIDRAAVHRHMEQFWVKGNSPMLNRVLGGDWAPDNAAVTLLHAVKTAQVAGCEAPLLGTYIDEVGFACGFTREFDSETSIEKKAKDVTKLLSEAVKQVPADKPSIIHIAAETMEGVAVERRRTEKVMRRIPEFTTGKPVVAIRFHRLQGHQRTNLLYEMDETVDKFQADTVEITHMPSSVVVPPDAPMQQGSHWELYS